MRELHIDTISTCTLLVSLLVSKMNNNVTQPDDPFPIPIEIRNI